MATNSRTSRKKQQNKNKKPGWKQFFKYALLLIMLCILAVGGLFLYFIVTAPKLDAEKLDVPYASQFYDMDGEVFADIGEQQRIKIKYDDLPKELIDAVTATEDVRFFKHKGIDLRRIAGAIKANIQRGFGAEGASTITQQVVEQMFLTPEKSIKLKVQEQWLALKLEREYTKEEILEMYLNKIFYGSNAYGVAKASEVYFGKEDLNDLTLLESAMLAGLPQRPTAYNPFENPDLMQKRVETVLKLMVRHGKISQADADEANNIDVASVLTDKKPHSKPYDAFVKRVEEELETKLSDVDIYSAGLKIYTTIDTHAQDHVETLLTDSDDNPIPYPDDELQAGMVVLDTKSSAIRAIGGGRNRKTGDFNYAFNDTGRQPGSVFKPIVAYGPAIEYEKWSTYHQLNDDKPFEYGNSKPIRNWNRQYQGWMSARYALSQSLNVPAAKTLEEIDSDQAKEFAENLGIEFATENLDPRDAIGGTQTNTTPLAIAGAYGAFGNEGIYTEPYTVSKVEFPDGSVVDLKPDSEAVMSDYTAYMITDMLKTAIQSGTGKNANISNLPVVGKTGTTNGPNNSWFSGYTTNYTISIWTGYNENDRIINNTQVPHALFKSTMTELSKDLETANFTKPDSVVEVDIEKGSNPPALPSEFTPKDNIVTELFVKGTEPTQVSEEFDELDPVSNLKAKFNEDSHSIDVTWDYDEEADVSFDVSYQMDNGDMKQLSTTEDSKISLSSIDDDASSYTIQVVVTSNESDMKSEPKSTTVKLQQEDDDENEDGEVTQVEGLEANYNSENGGMDVTWHYNGPKATFEVNINGQTQTVQSTNVHVNGVNPGQTYNITVTPVSNGTRGNSKNTNITIPEDTDDNSGNEGENDNNEDEQGNSE